MLTNYEIKDIIKVIDIFVVGGFLNIFRPLMTAGVPLMKNVFPPLVKAFWYFWD